MKNLIFSIQLFVSLSLTGQTTATNFNCNDCAGINHDLFADLDAGKVVVLIWVMPCSSCINGALTAQTLVQNALAANPGKVIYYLADDNGNTTCSTLNNWCSSNGITDPTVFSNSAIKMSDYGASGMPKVIVVGGTAHKVYYNVNAPNITSVGIKDAIDAAILDNTIATGISQYKNENIPNLLIYPNPESEFSNLSINIVSSTKAKIEIRNELGQIVAEVFNGDLNAGEHLFTIKTKELASGSYFVCFTDMYGLIQKRLVVKH